MQGAKILLQLWILWRWAGITLALWDVARWKPTAQSTNYFSDNHHTPLFQGDSKAFHTLSGPLQWWMVDLQGTYAVKQVVITNVLSSPFNMARLRNFRIEIFKRDPRHEPHFIDSVGQVCATHANSTLPDRITVFTCAPGIVGRYLRVIWENGYSNFLHFEKLEALVDYVFSKNGWYDVFHNMRTTDSPFLSLTTGDFWSCVIACNDRRDTELCMAFNWAPELSQCHLVSVKPLMTVNVTSDALWNFYRASIRT